MPHKVKILKSDFITHDTKRFIVEKPKNYRFSPGQATDIAINKPGFEVKKRSFTFCSLNEELVLEFTIKKYQGGVTEKIHELKAGDELIIEEPFGYIKYKGIGFFIAGGTGITPFIAIFRQLQKEGNIEGNSLIFTNKTHKDIIHERELMEMFGDNLTLTLTDEKKASYDSKRIDEKFLKSKINNFNQYFYVCGPKLFVNDIKRTLIKLGAKEEFVIFEK